MGTSLSRLVAATALLGGCMPPGTLIGPSGNDELRTALYAVGISDGAPELTVLLSNGLFECGLPNFDDAAEQDRAFQEIIAATCREGARHAVLHLYQTDPADWTGTFEGQTGADHDALTVEQPRLSRGAYYGIQEAFLIELDGLVRGYAAAEDLFLPDLGDGGEVTVDLDGNDHILGSFSFPDDDVAGEFRATRCPLDTSLLDMAAALPTHLCQ